MKANIKYFGMIAEKIGKSEESVDLDEKNQSDLRNYFVEEYPFSQHNSQSEKSHFNLLDPVEVHRLMNQFGCIDWCRTLEDWRWTELDVRDRASRLRHLYSWSQKTVVDINGLECEVNRIQVPVSID